MIVWTCKNEQRITKKVKNMKVKGLPNRDTKIKMGAGKERGQIEEIEDKMWRDGWKVWWGG